MSIAAHTWRDEDGDEVIRLVSARQATNSERQDYEENRLRWATEIRDLKKMRDRDIDTSDIPAASDWSKAVIGKFYRPIKKF